MRTVALVLVFFMTLLLGGCDRQEDSLIGKWAMTKDDITLIREFIEDGTIIERVSLSPTLRIEGTYTVDGDRLTLDMTLVIDEKSGKSFASEVYWEFSYSVKGNKLILFDLSTEDPEEVVYTRE